MASAVLSPLFVVNRPIKGQSMLQYMCGSWFISVLPSRNKAERSLDQYRRGCVGTR